MGRVGQDARHALKDFNIDPEIAALRLRARVLRHILCNKLPVFAE
jgi:hypothetical protein